MFLSRGDVYLVGRGGILWCRTDHINMRLIMALEKILFCVAKAYYSQTLYFRQLSCHLFSVLHRCFPVNFTKFLEHVFYSTAQQMIFSIKDFFSKCDQIRSFLSFLRIWSHLLKKSVIENFIFCAVKHQYHVITSP